MPGRASKLASLNVDTGGLLCHDLPECADIRPRLASGLWYFYHCMRRLLLIVLLALVPGLQSFSRPWHQPRVVLRISVRRPIINVSVHGAHLSKVEFWAIPTGTEITPDEYMLLGTGKHFNDAGWLNESWALPIPSEPISITHVFAKAFDAQGKVVATRFLPYHGASQLHDALWGNRPNDSGPQRN